MTKQYELNHAHDNPGLSLEETSPPDDFSRHGRSSKAETASPNGEEDLRCGFGSCKPRFLQVFNNPKATLAWLSWFAFVQGFVVNGINNVNTASLERRFELTSSQVSFISSAYDISAGIFVLPITYFATYAHQPRMLAISAFIMAIGSFVMAVPHFATDLYQLRSDASSSCDIYGNATQCDDVTDSKLSYYLGVFVLGQFLHGIGGTTIYSVGVVYIDSSVHARTSPIYQGIFYACSTVGPAIGYLLGGLFLSYFVDIDKMSADEITIDEDDPRWVGAWWIGFMLAGCLALTVFLLLLPYARELPHAAKVRAERESQTHADGSEDIASREGFGKSLKDLPTSLKLLLCNPVNMLVTFAGVAESFTTGGIATFLPKIIQNQFIQDQSNAAFLAGALAVPGSALGMLLGGILPRLLKLKIRGNIILAIVFSTIAICTSFSALLKCDGISEAGIDIPYPDNAVSTLSELNLTSECNAHCNCNVESYAPVCSDTGVQYFTPCHAGCRAEVKDDNGEFTYHDCSCIYNETSLTTSTNGTATGGRCDKDCTTIYVFLCLIFIVILTTFTQSVPGLTVGLRCIPESQRSFGMGVRWVFMRFLGGVLGPVAYGAAIDSTCQVWQFTCDKQGSCWRYDSGAFGLNIVIVTVVVKALGLMAFIIAAFVYKPPVNNETKSITNNDEIQNNGIINPAIDEDTT